MTKVWFTADLHIGHRMVAGLRGFDPAAHDATLAGAWDSLVKSDDHVWILGDLSAGGASGQRAALAWVSQRPGVKHLVAGNHDGIHPMHRDAHKLYPLYSGVFASVAPAARRRINGVEVLLSHFPYVGDHTEISRYDQWRLRDQGVPLLHGHTHQPEQLTRSESGTIQVHVGLDARTLAPVSIDQISNEIQKELANDRLHIA